MSESVSELAVEIVVRYVNYHIFPKKCFWALQL
jgi:hypothetical protein